MPYTIAMAFQSEYVRRDDDSGVLNAPSTTERDREFSEAVIAVTEYNLAKWVIEEIKKQST
jgi:hypothetical protein